MIMHKRGETMSILKIENLKKSYGQNEVLKGINLEIQQGEIFGILGVNGAGKTTLLECVEGIRKRNSGTIHICDLTPEDALKEKKFGVQMQSASLPDVITVKEVIELYASWNDHPKVETLLHMFDLNQRSHQTYQSLSTGWKRKLHLVLALIPDPEIIFLDEPTAGLDVEARAELHQMLKQLQTQGKTIVLSSHDMAEVESLCDRIAMLRSGHIHFLGTVKEFRNTKRQNFKVHIKCVNDTEYQLFEIESITDELPQILDRFHQEKTQIEDMIIDKPTLEDCFLDVAKGANE